MPGIKETQKGATDCTGSAARRNDLKFVTVSGKVVTFPDQERAVQPEELDALGAMLDEVIAGSKYDGLSVRAALMEYLLKIRNRSRKIRSLRLSRVQEDIDNRAGKRNIVLKARQLGITTYVAARFFVHTITRAGP